MSFRNPLIERWQSGGATVGAWMMGRDPVIAESLAVCGYDFVVVDQQHGMAGMSDAPGLFMAIAAGGALPATRVRTNDTAAIGRALDMGALAVIVPMVNTAEEAARAAAACRYAPAGNRSFALLRAQVAVGSANPADLERTALILQIETAAGLANAAAIASTPGVDAIFIGPFDLALSLGIPADPSQRSAADQERHAAAIVSIRLACENAGIAAGIYCADGAAARAYLDQGFRMVTAVTDVEALRAAAARELRAASGA